MVTNIDTLSFTSVINNRIDIKIMEDELLNYFRVNLTDRQNRQQLNSDSFIGDGSITIFELTGDKDSKGRHKLMSIKNITVNGVSQTFMKDYVAGFRKESPILGKIQFWNAPENDATIVVSYYYQYSFVYTESSRIDLSSNAYPRVSLELFNFVPKDKCIGGKVTAHDITWMITVVDVTRTGVTNITQELKNMFIDESVKHGFYSFDYIRNPRLTPCIPNGEDSNDIVFVQQVEVEMPAQYEFSK